MALGKQPFFKAPTLPKMGKKTVSSSIFSSASSVTPRLKTSSISFINPQQSNLATQTEILQSQVTRSSRNDEFINSTLTQTNRILVEIQKQLSFDFVSRQNEKKQALAASKAGVQRQRISAKERAIESVNKIRQGIAKAFDQVTAPARGIFDKIIQFFGTILTGILVNTAWKWLQNPENREKVGKFFGFIAEHWRWIVRIIVLGKLIGFLYKVYRIVSGLKKGIGLLAKALSAARNAGKGGGLGGGKNICADLLKCFKTAPEFANEVIRKLIAGGILAKTIQSMMPKIPSIPGLPQPIPLPKRQPAPRLTPQQQYAQSRQGVPSGGYSAKNVIAQQEKFKENYPDVDWGAVADWGMFGVAVAFPGEGIAADVLAIANLLKNGRITLVALRRILGPKAANAIVDFMRTKNMTPAVARAKGGTIPNSPIRSRESGGKKCDICSLLPTFSSGGTVGGPGSGNVDSVPAMLAPGEEVIRSSAAMLFRPLLKDINDNAGRLWGAFQDAIGRQEKNNSIQFNITKRFSQLLELFNTELKGLIQREKLKEIKKNPNIFGPGKVSNIPPEEGTGKGGPSDIQPPTPKSTPGPGDTGGNQTGKEYKPGDNIPESATKPKPPVSPVFKQPPSSSPSTQPTTQPTTQEKPQLPPNPLTLPVDPWKLSQTLIPTETLKVNSISQQYISAKPKPTREPATLERPRNRSNIVSMPMPPINMAANSKPPSMPNPSSGSATEVPAIPSFDLSNYYISSIPLELGVI